MKARPSGLHEKSPKILKSEESPYRKSPICTEKFQSFEFKI